MTTEKQAAANRRNAKKSTGPRTDEGKASSSQNALKHGLSADRVVIWDEDPAAFEALRTALFDHYQPIGPVAEYLVEQVAGCIWRLRRVPEIEAAIYSYFTLEVTTEDDEDDAEAYAYGDAITSVIKGEVFEQAEHPLASLNRLAGQLERSLYRAIQELERMKAERSETANGTTVFDAEPEQQPVIPRPRPRLSEHTKARWQAERSAE